MDNDWPDGMEMIRQLREAVGLFSGAMSISPKQAWDEALDVVVGLKKAEVSGMNDNAEKRLSVVANAIGYEMLRHDGRPIREIQGTDGIDVTAEEAARCRVAAERVLDHLAQFDTNES